jgi:protein tyrosine phosphatase (PTP) superfamily phosphohydrolase (DUF442 family)
MKVSHSGVLFLAIVLAAGSQGCACCGPDAAATGQVSSFGSCDSCSAVAQLPRGRLTPTPGVPLPPGGVPSGPPQVRLLGPETVPGDTGGGGGNAPGVGESARPTQPPSSEEPPALNADVPGFAVVKPRVASGQKPFADGLNWLKDKGYRTVLHIRPPGEDDSAVRRQFEAKGFRYLSLEVSPQALTPEIVDRFNRIVTDTNNLPLYVYDRDSSLVGGLWFLHFRIIDGLANEKATAEAARLGLNPDADAGPHREMWLAVQKYLQMSKR